MQAQRAPKSAEKREAAPKQVTLLDLKKCTAIGIRMARLKVPWQQAADAILSLDPVAFASAEDVNTIVQCLPSDDERSMLQVGVWGAASCAVGNSVLGGRLGGRWSTACWQ